MAEHEIGYAYPSSSMAKDVGYENRGAYYLKIDGVVGGFESYEAAVAAVPAGSKPSRWSMDNPNFPSERELNEAHGV